MIIPCKKTLRIPKTPVIKQFRDSWLHNHNEVMVSGPRNCGKTLTVLRHILTLHQLFPNLKSAVVRYEHKSIASTVLRTMRDRILRYPFSDERNPFVLYGGENRPEHLTFANGGQMDFRGLDGKGKSLGAEYDVVFVNQAEQETRIKVWEDLLGTMAGARGGNWICNGKRYWQLIADANPSTPHHFLFKRKEGNLRWFDFTHKENPIFYNHDTDTWSPLGLKTIEDLKRSYTGFDYARMVEGKWVAAEGMVYPQFSKQHVKPLKRSDFGTETTWYGSIDWGGTSLTAVGIYAVVGDQYYLFKEICKSQAMVSEVLDTLDNMMKTYKIPKLKTVYVDHNAEHVLQCRNRGLHVQNANKSVLEGIETVKRLIKDNRLTVNETALDERDANAVDKPQGFLEEVMSYAYPAESNRAHSIKDELPVKTNDHSCDHLRYALHSLETVGSRSFVVEPFFARID